MSELFRPPHEYGDDQSSRAALLIAGFGSTMPEQLENAANALADDGYNVFGYDFNPEVIQEGDAKLLPQLVDELTSDFLARTKEYTTLLPCGVSIGAGIAWETQKRETTRTQPGVYAAAGANSADGIFGLNPIMLPLRRAYTKKGYSHSELREIWSEVHTPPKTGFMIALGGLDIIVRYRDIMNKISNWQAQGIPIQTKTLWHLTHSGMIRWYDNNLELLLPEK